MRRSDLADVRQKWMWRMQRFSRSRLTVVAFCNQEQVSVAAFYQWRKKLSSQSAGQAVALPHASLSTTKDFVPVRLLQTPAVIEVQLVNGVSLTVPASDLELLRQTLVIVSQLPSQPAGREVESC